jgi:hypothetical protein
MSAEDYFDSDEDERYDEHQEVRCNRCGERYLHWERLNGKPFLANEDGESHVCKPSADDFEDLTR